MRERRGGPACGVTFNTSFTSQVAAIGGEHVESGRAPRRSRRREHSGQRRRRAARWPAAGRHGQPAQHRRVGGRDDHDRAERAEADAGDAAERGDQHRLDRGRSFGSAAGSARLRAASRVRGCARTPTGSIVFAMPSTAMTIANASITYTMFSAVRSSSSLRRCTRPVADGRLPERLERGLAVAAYLPAGIAASNPTSTLAHRALRTVLRPGPRRRRARPATRPVPANNAVTVLATTCPSG